MADVDDAVKARKEIDEIIDRACYNGGLTLGQTDRLQSLTGQIQKTRESETGKHAAFCGYYGKDHEGPCNPQEPGAVRGFTKTGEHARSGLSEQRTDPMDDEVNHPAHYTSHPSGIECIEVTQHMSFCLGNAVKYLWRAGVKGNTITDLEKAIWYIRREIKRIKK